MKTKAKQYAQALFEGLKFEKEESSKVVDKFVDTLIADNNVSQIEKILYYFNKIWNKENSVVEAEIKTSGKISDDIKSGLLNYLKQISKAEGIKITEKEDKKIMGGFVLKYNDKIIDASVKNRLNSFKNSLLN